MCLKCYDDIAPSKLSHCNPGAKFKKNDNNEVVSSAKLTQRTFSSIDKSKFAVKVFRQLLRLTLRKVLAPPARPHPLRESGKVTLRKKDIYN